MELLCQMSNISTQTNVFIICATNCPWDLDPAFLRRFQKRIYISLPSQEDRFELIQFYMRNSPLTNTFQDWGPFLKQTEGFSSSELADLASQAFLVPINELMDVKIWKMTVQGNYEPAVGSIDFSNCVCCELSDLPAGTAKGRRVQMQDLMATLKDFVKTVKDSDVKKYNNFCGYTQ